jgi:thioredoxin-like negative regulator of GroEL
MVARSSVLVAVAVIACSKDEPAKSNTPPTAAAACAGAEREGGDIHWFHDDYAKALACAKAKQVPLVIDMWAPWCHTCLSMQSYVLTDKAFADYDRRMVFLALDTDRVVNADVVKKFPPAAWPTFFVVSSVDESMQARFVGAASVEQFVQFLDDGERGHQALAGKPLATHEIAAREGDRASGAKEWDKARAEYETALGKAPKDWPRRPDVLVSLIATQTRSKSWERCASIALAFMDQTGTSASASDFASHALTCAEEHPDPAIKTQLREKIVAHLTALVDNAAAPLAVDDRSDALMYLRQALDGLERVDEARAAAERQKKLLDDATAAATDPRVAMTYNWPRSEVYEYLKVPLELVPALEKSIADLPKEYDPPYRLAWIYMKAGKLDEALRHAKAAEALAYGPRKTRVQNMIADIHKARGDVAAERAARQSIVATWESLPPAAQNPDALAKAKADVAALDGE